jgi:hypothetical protein
MALENSDLTSCGLAHWRYVDRLLISSSRLPECPVNNGVEQHRTLSWIHHMSAELKSRSRFNQDERLVEETCSRGMLTKVLLFTRDRRLGRHTLDSTSPEGTELWRRC